MKRGFGRKGKAYKVNLCEKGVKWRKDEDIRSRRGDLLL